MIVELAEAGLAGVEVDHPDHAPEDRDLLRGLAADLGLVVTGSSDYHGTNKTTPIGAETTAADALDAAARPGHRRRRARRAIGAGLAVRRWTAGRSSGSTWMPSAAGAGHPGPARAPGTTAHAATG